MQMTTRCTTLRGVATGALRRYHEKKQMDKASLMASHYASKSSIRKRELTTPCPADFAREGGPARTYATRENRGYRGHPR